MSRRKTVLLITLITLFVSSFCLANFSFTSSAAPNNPAPLAATITVTNLNDSGAGSLRQAIANAVSGDTITFSPSIIGPITLTSGQLSISKNLTIIGPGVERLSVERSSAPGTPSFRIFSIGANRTVSISGLTISKGEITALGAQGGGILTAGALTIDNCVIDGNNSESSGGGIAITGLGTLQITATTISGNRTDRGGGGAIYSSSSNHDIPVTIENCTLSGNVASSGGAIFNVGWTNVKSSTISGNTSECRGGGIYASSGTIRITSTTITDNFTSTSQLGTCGGGGIFNGGFNPDGITLGNTIVGGNSSSSGRGPDVMTPSLFNTQTSPITSDDYNLIGNTSDAQFIGATSHNIRNENPKLAPLADNAGPTKTHGLRADSPALDRGNNTGAPVIDQRGAPRIVDGDGFGNAVSDIGSFEVQRYLVTNTSDGGAGSLRQALLDSAVFGGFIRFNIPSTTLNCVAGGPCRIFPRSGLPAISKAVDIDGYSQPGALPNSSSGQNNNAVIRIQLSGINASGFPGFIIASGGDNTSIRGLSVTNFATAIHMVGASGCEIGGNFIGLDPAGLSAGNDSGIVLSGSSGNQIGGLFGAANIISGNSKGITLQQASNNNSINGNLIGVGPSGSGALPNLLHGVRIANQSKQNNISQNVIAFNGGRGVSVLDGTGNWITNNRIHGNDLFGIDLGEDGVTLNDAGDSDSGPNNLQNFPVIAYAAYDGANTIVRGTLNYGPMSNTLVFLEFFSNSTCDSSGHGEGETLIGGESYFTDATGNVSLDLRFRSSNTVGKFITATATVFGNTSEFSMCRQVIDPPGFLSFGSPNFSASEAVSTVSVNVRRAGGNGAVSVNYATTLASTNPATGGSNCQSGVDYLNTSGTLTWASGDTSDKSFSISLCSDHSLEPDELVRLILSDPTGGAEILTPNQATFTLTDNDAPGAVQFTATDFNANERDTTATITLTRTAVDSGPVSVNYATTTGGTAAGGSTCASDSDYLHTSGTLTWAAGDVGPKTFIVSLCQDSRRDGEQTINLALSSPTGGVTLGSPSTTVLRVADDELMFTVTNTNDSGPGSLRESLMNTNANTGSDSIEFAPGVSGTIDLLTSLPDISDHVMVSGPGANVVTVRRSAAPNTPEFRVFTIASDVSASIEGFSIANGVGIGGGGGVLNNGFLSLTFCAVSGNHAMGYNASGGGILSLGPSLAISGSTVSGNSATGEGGGVFAAGALIVHQSTVSTNSATNGGGIARAAGSASARVTRSAVAKNTASNSGGGLHVPDASTGFTLGNSLVDDNSATSAPDFRGAGVSLDFNLFGNTDGASITGTTTHDLRDVDARLGPLADNGGPTQTHALLVDSPAIDAATNSGVSPLSRDQRGQPRLVDGDGNGTIVTDIGPYECAVIFVRNTNDAGAGSLRQAIIDAGPGNDLLTIRFSPGVTGTINLLTPLPALDKRLLIEGTGAKLLMVRRGVPDGGSEFSVFKIKPNRVVRLSGLTIANGRTTVGGGIANEGTLTVDQCVITGNTASEEGGGVANLGTMVLSNSTVSNNKCTWFGNTAGGGGLYNQGPLTIINSTISGNVSSSGPSSGFDFGFGGGIFNRLGTLTISRSTITANTATYPGDQFYAGGGGIYSDPDGAINVDNSIIAGNHNPSGPDISGAFNSLDYNLIGNTSGGVLTGITTNNLINIDAQLAPLGDNGGPTPTHALLHSSPAIDAGSNTDAPNSDQRGLLRISDGNSDGAAVVDIGALEMQVLVVCATDVSSQMAVVRGGFRYNYATGRFAQTVKITNIGGSVVSDPISLVLDNLSPNAAMFGPTGTTSCAVPVDSPYIALNVGADGIFSPGEIVTLTLQFSNPSNGVITYSNRFLSGDVR